MAARTVFVDLGDIHGPLEAADQAADALGNLFVTQGNTTGILTSYATLAAAIADTANLVDGQYVLIAGGDGAATGEPNADRGVWKVNTNKGAARSDYAMVLDASADAASSFLLDSAGFYASTNVEGALAEIGTKQVFYKLDNASLRGVTADGTTSTAFDAAIKALVYDNAGGTDAAGVGAATVPGIIVNSTFGYQIPIRDASTRDIINDGNNNEVYARLTFSGGNYVVSFFSWVAGVETAFNMPSTSLDLGYVMASCDFMKLPAFAGVVQGEFFGDQAGSVGTISDTAIITNVPAFTGLLAGGLTTQHAVNLRVDNLGLTGAGNGAYMIPITDSAANFAVGERNVEAALAALATRVEGRLKSFATLADAYVAAGTEAFRVGTYVIITASAVGDSAERGIYQVTSGNGTTAGDYTKVLDISHTAAEVLIADAGNKFTGASVETAVDELIAAIGGASTTARTYSSTTYVANNDTLVVAVGKLDAAIAALQSDRVASRTAFTAGEALAAASNGPQLVSADGSGKVFKTVAGSVGPKPEVLGFATGADYATNGVIGSGSGLVMSGICDGFITPLTVGARYYASPTTPGAITATVPNVVGQWVIPVGIAISTTAMVVDIGDPQEIVPAQKISQADIHAKDSSGSSTGIGAAGYTVAVNSLWIDTDDTEQNNTKSGTGRHTVYVCKLAWTGAGTKLTAQEITDHFIAIGVQG